MNVTRNSGSAYTSGVVADDAVGTACLAAGALIGAGWTVGSHIHTLVAAPITSIGMCLTSAGLAGTGAYRLTKDIRASKQTVDTTAAAVA